MKYRREIDGLRAVAVIPVILFHAGFDSFSGGFVGVDVFFVVSGYLITSIICSDIEQNRFSTLGFYERRARRILPALFIVSLACIPFAWLWMLPSEYESFSQSLVGVATFTSNILFWRESGYFADAAELKPLLHTWSLAVEEQFYILYPPLMIFLYRFMRRWIFLLISLTALASLLLAHYASAAHPAANFYLLPSRAWELAAGALLALCLQKNPSPGTPRARELGGLIGLGLILCAVTVFDEATPFPSFWTLMPVLGTALVILTADRKTLTGRLLGLRMLVGIGLVSYSAYLWHQPLFAFARLRLYEGVPVGVYWLLIALTFLLAWVTWGSIEVPARKRFRFPRSQILLSAVLACLAVALIGGWGFSSNGFPSRIAPSGSSFSELSNVSTKPNYGLGVDCDEKFTLSSGCRTGDKPSIAVWGDSYAMHLMQALMADSAISNSEFIQFTKSSCAPLLGLAFADPRYSRKVALECIDFNKSVRDWLKANSDIRYVIMSSPLSLFDNPTYDVDGNLNIQSADLLLEKFNETANFIRSLGKKPIFIGPPPRTGADLSRCAIGAIVFGDVGDGQDSCEFLVEEISPSHAQVAKFLDQPDLELPVVDLREYLCDREKCTTVLQNVNIYRDGGHFSRAGSSVIGEKYSLLNVAIEAADSFYREERVR